MNWRRKVACLACGKVADREPCFAFEDVLKNIIRAKYICECGFGQVIEVDAKAFLPILRSTG